MNCNNRINKNKINFANNIGISSACFYPMYTEEAFNIIVNKLSYNLCEFFFNTLSETDDNFIKLLKSIQHDREMRYSAVHPFLSGFESAMFFSDYKRRFSESLDIYKNFFEVAQKLEADYVVFHGHPQKDSIPIEIYYQVFAEINAEAKKYNVILCQENVAASSAFIKNLKNTAHKYNDEVFFVFDIKHAIISGTDPFEMMDIMAENIKHIHLNDYYFNGELSRKNCRLPLYGNFDYKLFFSKLSTYNYIGDFIVEVYRENYQNIQEMLNSKNKLEKFLHDSSLD